MQGIYKIVNKVNGKYYVGSTNDFHRRWMNEHLPELRAGEHGSIYLQNAWNKYGEGSFEFQIAEEVKGGRKDLICREQEYLNDGLSKRVLYNMTPIAGGGSITGWHHTDETKRKISESQRGPKGYWWGKKQSEEHKRKNGEAKRGPKGYWWGRHLTDITKQKISIAKKGVKPTEEHRQKNSAGLRRYYETHAGVMKGKKHSEETRQKMSDSIGRPYPAFYNGNTKQFVPAGSNLWRMCQRCKLRYDGMRGLKNKTYQYTLDGWRLATAGQIECYGSP